MSNRSSHVGGPKSNATSSIHHRAVQNAVTFLELKFPYHLHVIGSLVIVVTSKFQICPIDEIPGGVLTAETRDRRPPVLRSRRSASGVVHQHLGKTDANLRNLWDRLSSKLY
jgi:hypothetical protein